MIDLLENCGLPVALNNEGTGLVFDGALLGGETDTRMLPELSAVLFEKAATGPATLYTLYNDMGDPDTRARLAAHGIRYDIGVLPPLKVGREYIKTTGHYHGSTGAQTPAAEAYEIVHGHAHFILQKQGPDDDRVVEDVAWIEATAGDRMIVPPDYAHVTINPGPDTLVMANVAATACELRFDRIVRMGGMSFFNIDEGGESVFVANSNYEEVPPLREARLRDLGDAGIESSQPLYEAVADDPAGFAFITTPEPCSPFCRQERP